MENSEKRKEPLYIQIYHALKRKVWQGEYVAGDRLPSERELGLHYSVERATVRRALSLLVNDGLVEKVPGYGTRVRDYSLNYSKSESKNILFFLPKNKDETDILVRPFNAILFNTIQDECMKHGYNLIYSTICAQDDLKTIINQSQASGIIFVSTIPVQHLNEAAQLEIPSVLVNHFHPELISIVIDTERGAFMCTNHLISLGHKNVAYIGGLDGYITQEELFSGYKRAFYEAGYDWRKQISEHGNWTFAGGYEAMKRILERKEELPSAIFVGNDVMAFGAIMAIKEKGLKVPDDISVAGFDDIEANTYYSEQLTTIKIDINAIGRIACQMLFNSINFSQNHHLKIVCPVELIVRNTTREFFG